MPGIDGTAILSVWERGVVQSLGDRALTFLELAGVAPEEARTMPVGMRDMALLRIRQRLFGDRMDAVAACERCAEEMDIVLSVEELLDQARPAVVREVSSEVDGSSVVCRIPTAGDLADLRDIEDVEIGVAALIERCLIRGDPAAVVAVEESLAGADPGGELCLVSICPYCGARNEMLFDAPSFLSKELRALADGVLWDVHTIAGAYGWDEETILRLTPSRRRFYMQAIAQ
jgi:hypothetical protein